MTAVEEAELDSRTTAMVEMYDKGATLQEIGDQFGLTRERVRQLLKKTGRKGYRPPDTLQKNHMDDAELAATGEWLREQGLITWEEFHAGTGLSWEKYQLGVLRGFIPRNLVLARVSNKPPVYTFEDAVAAVTDAYERSGHKLSGKDKTFTGGLYEEWKQPDQPSLVLIAMKWRWANVAEAAGVPMARRPLRRKTNYDGMMESIGRYVDDCLAVGDRPTGNGYHEWSVGRTDCYTFSSVRLVLRREGIKWQDAVLLASKAVTA